ncbi:MAG: 5-deoxy-glucuronate isomerase [Opitutaceae bacterium]|jgi:5-deoxy-glucuronate isomerase
MPLHLKAQPNHNQPIVAPGQTAADRCYFNLLHVPAGESVSLRVPGFETLYVVMSGSVDITAGPQRFSKVGQREDIWSGPADSVYAGTGTDVVVTGQAAQSEVAVAGGRCDLSFRPFRVEPAAVQMVDVGSRETHSRRRIFHLLGQNAAGRAGPLLVSELFADPGCWSGYPPHKHDEERPPEETNFQEIYHYRFRPESGFGAQYCYEPGRAPQVVMTGHKDTFVVDRGYHPTVTSPGHEEYIFTILVGVEQRSLIQYFDPAHRHLMEAIPGLQAMRDKFRG